MKKHTIIILAFVGIVFSSCDLSGDSNFTPHIYFLINPVKNNTDTLNRYFTDNPGVFLMDTIHVGDTVQFFLYLNAFSNNLVSFKMNHEPDSVFKMILPDKVSMDSIFLPESQYDRGLFQMAGKHSALFFPFRVVALQASNSAKLRFTVVSDARFDGMFGSNASGFELKTPILPKRIRVPYLQRN